MAQDQRLLGAPNDSTTENVSAVYDFQDRGVSPATMFAYVPRPPVLESGLIRRNRSSSFPGTPAITVATAYALFQTGSMGLVAIAWGRLFMLRIVAGEGA